ISIKEIYSLLNISKSKLEQHFNREVGLTPKEFCKIEKLNCFINSYKEDTSQSLTELTYQCGYYDQSHLIKDFKYFLDTSPKKFFLNESA
ncbi:MAG: helix-turn-helix domain-containing protein, partial [Bacteroidota bacterium]